MKKTTFFVEGIQGAGKTTMVNKLSKEHLELKRYHEGDYSPVELAWCTYNDKKTYDEILGKYEEIADDIKAKTVKEGERYVIPYTQILTDIKGFHRDLEQYEIYNGRVEREEFEKIVLCRFQNWDGEGSIFECSIFQNIIENMILYFEMSDEEILEFYKKVKSVLEGKDYKIVYLVVDDIEKAENVIRKERCDERGNELWFPLMTRYLEESPYGKQHHLEGMAGLVSHLKHRVDLERRILQEVFGEQHIVHVREIGN